ncbi:radical SAM protein [Patescibacteria group bacterium]|nr:radical SAM protein [Patescibacteria group bacterium]
MYLGIVSFFLSKINTDKFSELIKKSAILTIPYKIVAQRLIDKNFPSHIFLETTSACNLRCQMCARNLAPIKIGFLDLGLAKKIVDEATAFGPRTFSLHLFGEPLLYQNLSELINYIKNKNQKNTILLTTNAVLLSGQIGRDLITSKLDKIFVSIHASTNEHYQKITGTNNLDRVETNIKNLIKLKKETSTHLPKIHLRLVISKEEKGEITNFYRKWNSLPITIDVREPHNFGGRIESSREIKTRRYPCYHLWFSPGITWDGQVIICCNDTFREAVIGDATKESLHKVWRGKQLKLFRHYHLTGQYDKISVCKNCDVWTTYPDIFFKWQKKLAEKVTPP